MPRDSAGNTQPLAGTIVSTGDTILPSQHNPMVNDVYAMMTQSLSRDGQGGMRANLDMSGQRIINVAPATLPNDAVNFSQVNILQPLGIPLPYLGATAPTGYVLCFGQPISRTTYSALFAVLGTTYGPGDGSTTFNLPDFRGRVLAGADNMGGTAANRLTAASGWFIGATLGNFAGLETHTLTTPQIPSHNHGITDPGHGHLFDRPAFMADIDRGTGSSIWSLDTLQTAATTQGATGITINNTGGGSAHNNVQPSIIVNYILRTGI